ncbi:T9SS type A sorting domain-containing protein [Aurantibacillus circumpalustris]|uniref:T9SS type A sorting domain-containing protein n=1 Tax=Aurantibacillus circumpalustris TaxID=3036359 RepID=UPI00295C0F34|nr:choice-of-anchor V domain-containing protein [Aurantibacillus circumpalustris]
MKKTFITVFTALTILIGTSAFITKYNNGIAGYAGSPGEATCTSCHGGGFSANSGLTITAVPAFSVNANSDTEYTPDSVYQITIQASATNFSKFGFASQILNPSNTNAGVLQNAGTGVKFLNIGAKRSAVHNSVKTGASVSFTYKWVAPSSGDATIYAIANAVNGNNSTSGDFVIAPISMPLIAGPIPTPPVDTTLTVGLKENKTNALVQVSIFPNPIKDLGNISYNLKKTGTVGIELIDMRGALVKQLYNQPETPGYHSQIINLNGIASGVYFIKTTFEKQKVSQKLITVQ